LHGEWLEKVRMSQIPLGGASIAPTDGGRRYIFTGFAERYRLAL